MADETILVESRSSIERIQKFDVSELPRENDLGTSFHFKDAVPHAQRLIELFQKIPLDALNEFPDQQLNVLKQQADSTFSLFEQIAQFDVKQQNAASVQQSIINKIEGSYQAIFNQLMPFISYGVARTVDFSRLEIEGRAALQNIRDKTDEIFEEIDQSKIEAAGILDEIKRTAAEQGVSQQASYFAEESKEHTALADEWKTTTRNWAIGIIVYGFVSFFFHKIPWIAPTGISESIIFIASKILIFAILSYMLILSARNFLSHKHNAVVNKHRQNALMTFNALVSASAGGETQDIILTHASSCIFSPQDTGYTKHGGANNSQMPNIIEMLPKTSIRADG
ncbi:MAG: hypothetical protein JKY82_00070 [Rhizobiaceae bacterium]|nr:hypothetical protein [Rhizobiaceae bacterium]